MPHRRSTRDLSDSASDGPTASSSELRKIPLHAINSTANPVPRSSKGSIPWAEGFAGRVPIAISTTPAAARSTHAAARFHRVRRRKACPQDEHRSLKDASSFPLAQPCGPRAIPPPHFGHLALRSPNTVASSYSLSSSRCHSAQRETHNSRSAGAFLLDRFSAKGLTGKETGNQTDYEIASSRKIA